MDVAHLPIYELSKHDEKKLRISLALIGPSKVLLLDEPLLSLDLNGRRAVWQLLKKHKKGKIILGLWETYLLPFNSFQQYFI